MKIKFGDTALELNLPKIENVSTVEVFNNWCKLIEEEKEDLWYEIPALPGYSFKNLKLIQEDVLDGSDEITVTIKYDDWKNLNDKPSKKKKNKK